MHRMHERGHMVQESAWIRKMSRVCLGALLILLAMLTHLIAPCPSSCMVCSEEVTLCQGLTYILAAPISTQALIITDGSITSVEGFNLSFLLNATFLSLSTNGIKAINDDAFLGLRTLKTLLLDQNEISSISITYSTFHELQKLQVLVLSNNVLSTIHGVWFKNTKALIKLHLNGNQLTSINIDSFEMADLGNLRILDLSNNFINSIAKRAFHGLPQLMEINLSRNRLALIPDTFSLLGQLKLLSLDQNWWNCTCKLYDLASFLRQYVNASKILRNHESMNCTASENPSVTNLLQLTKINCRSALKQPSRVFKKERKKYGRDIALVAFFFFVGGVGLTCIVLAFFNRKLQPGKANEHPSENCCCRVLDESQCDHEPRNYLTKGYCNCHLTWENGIKVMSNLGDGEEMPYLPKNSYHETIKPECKCTGLKNPFGNIQSKTQPMKNEHFLCFKCRLLQSFPQEASRNIAVPNKTELPLHKHFQRTQRSENSEQFMEDSLNARLKDDTNFNQGIRSDTRQGGRSRPVCALVQEKLGDHLANELCQSLSQTEYADCFKPYKQKHLITALSSATDTLEESKEHCMQAALEHHKSQCEFLARNRNITPQLDHFLISKYINCDKNQDCPKVMEENHGKTIRFEAEQSEDKGTKSADCNMNAANIPLSPAIKKTKKPKQVSFYIPELTTIKRASVTNSGLRGKRFPQNKQRHEQIQGNQSPTWAELLSDSEAEIKERQPSSSPLMDPPREKENKPIQRYKVNTKSPHSLTVQLNLHLFRKGKIQPQELHRKSLEQPTRSQPMRPLPTSQMEEKKRKRKKSVEYSTQEKLENSKDGIYNIAAVEEVPEENGKDEEIPTSASFRNMSALNIKAFPSMKHLKPPTTSPTFSVNRTSRRTVPIIPSLSGHSPNIAPNITNNISSSLSSKKLKKGTSDAEVLSFHQNSPQKESKEKHYCLSPVPFSQEDGLDFQKPSNEDYIHSQQIMEDRMHTMSIDHFQNQSLKEQNGSFSRKDELEGQEKVSESESVQENLSSMEPQNVVEMPPSNAHQIISEKETDRLISPVHSSSMFHDSQVMKEELQINIREVDETLTQRLRSDFKMESNSELIPNTSLDSPDLKEETAQSGDEWDNNKSIALHKNIVKVAIASNTFNIPSSSESGSLYLNRNVDPQKNHNMHMDNDHNLQKNLPFDEDSTKHKEGKMPLATHQELPLLAEFKDVNYEQRTETSSLSCNINKAEISVPMPTPSPTSIDYKENFPLQVEQSKANLS